MLWILCLKLEGEERRTSFIIKIVEYNLHLHAHNGCGFDTWIKLNNLPCDKQIVDIVKNGKGIISLRVFNGYIHNGTKQIPKYLKFRCGMTHFNYSLKNLRKISKLQKEILKTEMNHDKVFSATWKSKKLQWLD